MALQGCSEWEAFQAVRLWAAGGAEQAEVERLLPLVRFPFMSPQELQVRPDYFPSTARTLVVIQWADLMFSCMASCTSVLSIWPGVKRASN